MEKMVRADAAAAFVSILKAGYIETHVYELPRGQQLTVFNKKGRYAVLLEHAQGYQLFKEVDKI